MRARSDAPARPTGVISAAYARVTTLTACTPLFVFPAAATALYLLPPSTFTVVAAMVLSTVGGLAQSLTFLLAGISILLTALRAVRSLFRRARTPIGHVWLATIVPLLVVTAGKWLAGFAGLGLATATVAMMFIGVVTLSAISRSLQMGAAISRTAAETEAVDG